MTSDTPTAAIGIICKTPRTGTSKTRLQPLLGPAGAAELAGCFLRDIASTIDSLPLEAGCRGYAVYAPEGSEDELRRYVPPGFGLVCRRDATLGVVLLGATEHLLAAGHDVVVLVNADSPTLPAAFLAEAIAAARAPGDRVVLGPAHDGGYYLVAVKRAHARLFSDIPWSTADVLSMTQVRAREIGLETHLLPPWYDIDDASSLKLLIDELSGRRLPFATAATAAGSAHASRRFLLAHPELAGRLSSLATSSTIA